MMSAVLLGCLYSSVGFPIRKDDIPGQDADCIPVWQGGYFRR